MEGLPLWDIVTTLKAPPGQIDRFVAHHLRAGANRIHLIFDDPASFHFIDDPRVSCCVPGDVHWGSAGRPAALEERQIISANAVARISRADWILNSDIDEYLDADRPVSELLSEQPEEVCALTVWPVEPLYTAFPQTQEDIFSARYFKVRDKQFTVTKNFWRERYGEIVDISSAGFWAHRKGKSLVRTRLIRETSASLPHHVYSDVRGRELGQRLLSEAHLRHFDALSFDDWLKKNCDRVERRVLVPRAGDKRMAMAQLVHDTLHRSGREGARDLFERLYGIGDAMLRQGLKEGLIIERPPL